MSYVMPASLRQRSRRPSAAPWRSQTKTTARGSASTTLSIASPPRLGAWVACSVRRARAQHGDCLARAAVVTRERAASRLRRGGRRAGAGRHHHAGDRCDRECGQHHAARRRRRRRRHPPCRRPRYPGRVSHARRLRHRRRQAHARLAARGAAWHRGEGRPRVSAAEKERTAKRRVLVALVLLGVVLGRPAVLRAQNAAAELGLAVGAAAGNLVYLPVKVMVAFGGLALGSLTGALTGGDVRAAYALWVPAASGT